MGSVETLMRIDAVESQMNYIIILENLSEFATYRIQVSAFTRIGEGGISEQVVITDPDMSSPPTNLEVTAINSTAIGLMWGYPQFPRGVISGYIITVSVTSNMFNVTLSMADDMSEQSFTVGGLEPFTEYGIQVAAYAFHEGVVIVGAVSDGMARTNETGIL